MKPQFYVINELTEKEVTLIFGALLELPAKFSRELLGKIEAQVAAQNIPGAKK